MKKVKDTITFEDVAKMAALIEKPKHYAINPYVRIPVTNEKTLGQEKEDGNLPSNIHLSKAVPLLTPYVFDASLLDFPMPKPEPLRFEFKTLVGFKLT